MRFRDFPTEPRRGKDGPLAERSYGRKNAPVGRCFLRVREATFSGAAFGLSTKKRVGKLLCFPTLFLCSAGVVASRRVGLCPRPRQGYRALDCGMPLRGLGLQLCALSLQLQFVELNVLPAQPLFIIPAAAFFGAELCLSVRSRAYFPSCLRGRRPS